MAKSKLAQAIKVDLDNLIGQLVEVGLADSQNFASINSASGKQWSVSTDGGGLSLALKQRPYSDIYRAIHENKKYGVLLLDGAMLQFSYEGVAESLVRHRLSYLPSPSLVPFQEDPDLYFQEMHFVEIVGHQVVPVPMRFDFDSREGVAINVKHPVSHLTLGQYEHCRIPVMRAISPSEFVDFVVRNFYSTPESPNWETTSRVANLTRTITDEESKLIHMSVPEG